MQYTVRDWMMDLLVYVDPEMSVADALAIMRRRYIQSVIVRKTKDNPEYGIVTTMDICGKIIAADQNPSKLTVREIMTAPLITANADWSLKECSKMMVDNRIHHLPVVNNDGELVGMISAVDFLVVAEAIGRGPGNLIPG